VGVALELPPAGAFRFVKVVVPQGATAQWPDIFVPFDERAGRFANDEGRILAGLYCVGWARRGPTGTIGTNRPDGYEVAEQVATAMPAGSDGGKPGGEGLDALLKERGIEATSFDDWRAIEQAEEAQARPGSPREKFVRHHEWMKVLGRPS